MTTFALAECIECGAGTEAEVPHCVNCAGRGRIADHPCNRCTPVALDVDRVEALRQALHAQKVYVTTREAILALEKFDKLLSGRG